MLEIYRIINYQAVSRFFIGLLDNVYSKIFYYLFCNGGTAVTKIIYYEMQLSVMKSKEVICLRIQFSLQNCYFCIYFL